MRYERLIMLLGLAFLVSPAFAQNPSGPQNESVFLEELTWMEVQDAIVRCVGAEWRMGKLLLGPCFQE